MATRAQVKEWCESREIELSVEHWANGITHVHANIAAPGKIFCAHQLHNLGLWDAETPPNWAMIYKELIEAAFGDCAIIDCDCRAE